MLDRIAVSDGLSVFLLEIEFASVHLASLNFTHSLFFNFSQFRISPITFENKSNPTNFLWPEVKEQRYAGLCIFKYYPTSKSNQMFQKKVYGRSQDSR